MSERTLTDEDIKAISQELMVVVERCLDKLNGLKTANLDDLINVSQVADILQKGNQTIYKLIKRGELNAIKIGKNYYVTRNEMDNYIKNQ